jgi:hypothetical protein
VLRYSTEGMGAERLDRVGERQQRGGVARGRTRRGEVNEAPAPDLRVQGGYALEIAASGQRGEGVEASGGGCCASHLQQDLRLHDARLGHLGRQRAQLPCGQERIAHPALMAEADGQEPERLPLNGGSPGPRLFAQEAVRILEVAERMSRSAG